MFRRYGLHKPRYLVPAVPHLLVAVDLGKTKAGVAIFRVEPANNYSVLVACATVNDRRLSTAVVSYAQVDDDLPVRWVCEWPMKYDDRRLYHEAIEDLQAVGNSIEELVGGWSDKYRPGEWKGHVPKRAHHRRVRKALRPSELAIMPSVEEHDAWDAVGIGLFALARTKRGGA
jgi:hypothetical protein